MAQASRNMQVLDNVDNVKILANVQPERTLSSFRR